MTKKLFLLSSAIIVSSLALFASTGYVQEVASPTPAAPTATALPGSIGPTTYPSDINPLTGLLMTDPTVLERRPLAIKVSNAPSSVRPQAGLSQADLVFEHYVEGSLTRFTAVFYTNTPSHVGSVRSARLIDLQIPVMYQSLFAFSGASGPILLRIDDSPFASRAFQNSGAPRFFRDPEIEIPHNLFAVPAAIWERTPAERPDLPGMAFVHEAPPGAISSATTIIIDYGPVVAEWRYHASSNLYYRYVDDDAHIDALNGRQITASNVIVLWAHHQPDVTIVENEWQGNKTYSTEIQIWTLGPMALFRDGRRYDGYWHRWADENMLTFWADDTMVERLYLHPGNTWFQVVPLDFGGLRVYVEHAQAGL